MDYDLLHFLRQFTAGVFLALMFGVALGYVRILWNERERREPVVLMFSWSVLLLVVLQGLRAGYNAFVGPLREWTALVYNISGGLAAYLALKTLHLMIEPKEERERWHWYSAPAYPGLGLTATVRRWFRNLGFRD